MNAEKAQTGKHNPNPQTHHISGASRQDHRNTELPAHGKLRLLLTSTCFPASAPVQVRAFLRRGGCALHPGGWGILWCVPLALTALLLASSCGTLDKPLVMPPSIPGATFVGSSDCATCHEDVTRFFPTATHARLMARGTNALAIGCEGCHGPGSLHSQSGGNAHTIINPGKSPEVCFQCHLDKRGQFTLPYHHPVLEGRLTCSSCHDPHRGDAVIAGGTALLTQKDICIQCHVPQVGPFVFEHEAMRDGCTSCHSVHGSVNAKLLQQRNANLCLKCHFQRQTTAGQIFIGTQNHTGFLSRGTCWSAGCHEAVHGSQVSTLLRF